MKIFVCVKPVGGELNPFDACAVEEALRIRGGEVYTVSMCPAQMADILRPLTRLGVKKVYLLSDRAFAGSDTLATARVLAAFLKLQKPDLILCGRQTVDGDTAQVGPCLSALLGLPLVTNVMKMTVSVSDGTAVCESRLSPEPEIVSLPAVLTVERINTLRFPSLRSKMGEAEIIENDVLGLDPATVGLNGSPTQVVKTWESDRGRRFCTFREPKDFLSLIDELKHAPDIGKDDTPAEENSGEKLPLVWAVGDAVLPHAERLGKTAVCITPDDPAVIARRAEEEKPDAILWNADLWGRRNAPIAAALLGTGLCADCTGLETDGERLYMIRPARSGSILAKIRCRTDPQMATVRTRTASSDCIVSGGRGVSGKGALLERLASAIGAEIGASRALVDLGEAPYAKQIGLTGRTVSPKLYLAVGISGAVQHMCAVENAGTVIAVNPDRNAPIFDCADYGFVCTIEELLEEKDGK